MATNQVDERLQREIIDLKVSIDARLDWLMDCANGDHKIREQIATTRQQVNQALSIQEGQLTALKDILRTARAQRDNARQELDLIALDVEDLNHARHPLMKHLAEIMRASISDRIDEAAERKLSQRYDEILADAAEYGSEIAEESIWDSIAEMIGEELDMTPVEAYDFLNLLTGLGTDVLLSERVVEFHHWLGGVREDNWALRQTGKNGR